MRKIERMPGNANFEAFAIYCTWLTISLARDSDSTICWHSFLRRIV